MLIPLQIYGRRYAATSASARKSIALNFCFHPSDTVRDSSVMTWGTDISNDRKTVKKNFSILFGFGYQTGTSLGTGGYAVAERVWYTEDFKTLAFQ